jgi:hypothetical protein
MLVGTNGNCYLINAMSFYVYNHAYVMLARLKKYEQELAS